MHGALLFDMTAATLQPQLIRGVDDINVIMHSLAAVVLAGMKDMRMRTMMPLPA